MQLSKEIMNKVNRGKDTITYEQISNLPDKVIQFGTGVLLRGLPDYFINKANQQGIFNGRVVAVKSTMQGDVDTFKKQDCLYTLCVNGVKNGKIIEETIINSSISRVISANSDWDKILECAENPDLKIVISNTTETGIAFTDDTIYATPPKSFPGKLLSFLYKRYQFFKGDTTKGMVIIPTELIPDNGNKLLSIINELAGQNNLERKFLNWLTNSNHFCNSLVDRIVPGKLPPEKHQQTEMKVGYKDDLMITAEPYRLWAIETTGEAVNEILSFSKCDEGVILSPDINLFRELKLRLLNGTHTFCCGLAHLAGFNTVKEAMDNPDFVEYITRLMMEEIVPSITNENISSDTARGFASQVLDRFRNPHIEHLWLNITMQYSSKMKMRNIPVIQNWYERFETVPELMSLGLSAHLLFMKSEQAADGKFYGESNGKKYLVNDDNAAWYADKWGKASSPAQLVLDVLGDAKFWVSGFGSDTGLLKAITSKLQVLISNGAVSAIKKIGQPAKPTNVS